METVESIKVDRSRLEQVLNIISRIGITRSGSERTAYSIKDIRAKEALVQIMRRVGLSVTVDAVGNIFGRTEQGHEPALMIGSHVDSVPGGGRFDGVAGVAAAVELTQTILENRIPIAHPIEVCGFSAEESSRFGIGTMGSAIMTGELSPADIMHLEDRNGIKLEEVLSKLGATKSTISDCRRRPEEVFAYLELHVEQGPVLEASQKKIGIVTAIAAPTRIKMCFVGRADHSGTTPMNLRKDALAAASEFVLALEDICRSEVEGVVGTVGTLNVFPDSMNVVPGRVELGVDIRSVSAEAKRKAKELALHQAREIAETRGLNLETNVIREENPVALHPEIVSLEEQVCKSGHIPYSLMISGAGHDAMNMAKITRAGMIFVPSRMGLSHNPDEWTDLNDIELGTNCLLHTALGLLT
ncbi:MAG: Zn-dependent hydrolase [archaeon]